MRQKEEQVKAEVMCRLRAYTILKIKNHESQFLAGCENGLSKERGKDFYFRASEAFGMRNITREFEKLFEENSK